MEQNDHRPTAAIGKIVQVSDYALATATDLLDLVWVGPLGNGNYPRKRAGNILYSHM